MLPQRVMIYHSDPMSEPLPRRWTRYWKVILSRKAQAVYTHIRQPVFDGEMVDTGLLAAELLVSRTGLLRALEELQEYGFVALDEGLD